MRGHVRKRGNTWTAVMFVGYNENGKSKHKWKGGFRTKKEAEKYLAQRIEELNRGAYREPTKDSFESYILDWLKVKETQVRPNTFQTIKARVHNRIIPALGYIPLSSLQPKDLQAFYGKLQRENLTDQTVLHIHRLLHDALARAVKWQLIPTNPAEAVDPPKVKKPQMHVWGVEEVVRFLEVAEENRWHVFFMLAITAGMRMGEILGLTWDNIDLNRKRLRVVQTVSFATNKPVVQEPKTKQSRREVTLPDETVQALKKHRARQIEEKFAMGSDYQDDNFVVTNKDGTVPRPTSVRDQFKRLVKKAGLPPIRIHDLRHTHASLLLAQNVHPKVISERLGHSTIGITMDLYTHVLPSVQEQAATTFGESVFGKKKEKTDVDDAR